MRVALVIGPCREGKCGVGDYTRVLARALEREGLRVEVIEGPQRGAFRGFRLEAAIRACRADITHLQYPTAGFGRGLTPQILSLLSRFVLTVHELEGTHLLRRLSFYPLWARARHVIFTCESNQRYSLRWAPWLRKRTSVIPLSSNIPAPPNGHSGRTLGEIIHFGLVRPKKGIEDVVEFANLAVARRSALTVSVVGSSPAQHSAYLASVKRASLRLPMNWDLDLSAEAVAERLGRATAAYLPFPDGASEKNTSLLAALANGLPVITTKGPSTPLGLEGAVWFCSSPAEAIVAAQVLLDSPLRREELAVRGRQYAARFRWESIAQSHVTIYQQLAAADANHH